MKKQQHLREGSHNPYLCLYYDRGAAMLYDRAAKAGLDDADAYAAKSAELRQAAQALAEKFDARNGSDYFAKLLTLEDTLH
jgi:hypothetical protein